MKRNATWFVFVYGSRAVRGYVAAGAGDAKTGNIRSAEKISDAVRPAPLGDLKLTPSTSDRSHRRPPYAFRGLAPTLLGGGRE